MLSIHSFPALFYRLLGHLIFFQVLVLYHFIAFYFNVVRLI